MLKISSILLLLVGLKHVTCSHGSSSWMQCQPAFKAPAHGSVRCTNGNNYGSVCMFACDEGYEMLGLSDYSKCDISYIGRNFKWSSDAPRCADCETYEFKISKTKGTFDEVRTECIGLGGDLLHKNFGPAGAKYHKEIEALYSQSGLILWIGYTDREKEGTWRFLDGELYDARDTNLGGFCNWGPGEPNNYRGNQHCAKIYGAPVLDDDYCGHPHHGMCEIKTSSCKV